LTFRVDSIGFFVDFGSIPDLAAYPAILGGKIQ
jgi:hypothetical protein